MSSLWTLRLSFTLWKSWYQDLEIDARRQEVQRLRSELNRRYDSIYTMNKAALVGKAIRDLGWTRMEAERETCGQLRLYLKEHAQANKTQEEKSEWGKPKGLNKWRHADLADEAERRGISLLPPGQHRHPTREEFIRAILQHVEANHVPNITSAATSTRATAVPPWQNQGNPVGSTGPSTGSSSGPQRKQRPLHFRHAARRTRSMGATPSRGWDANDMECDLVGWHDYGEDDDL